MPDLHRLVSPLIIAAICATGAAFAQGTGQGTVDRPVEASQGYIRSAGEAFRSGDLHGAVAALETALSLNPASLSTRYNLACLYALTGRDDESLELLADLAARRVDFGMADDPDLETLRGNPAFQAIVKDVAVRTREKVASEPFVTFEQYGLIPEGIALDPESGRLFFGSMRTGEIYAVGSDGRVSRFSSVDPQSRLSAVGLAVDSKNGLLWATGSAFELAENSSSESPATSALVGIDLSTGAVRERIPVADPDDWLNDVLVTADGRLFATGSALFRADDSTGRLERIDTSVEVFGSNGIAYVPGQNTLLVASYPVGLYAVDAASGNARLLEPPADTTLYGLDGIYWHDGALIGIQNGANPWRLLRLHLDDGLRRVAGIDILEIGSEATTPMTGAIDGDAIYYVGETEDPGDAPSQFPELMRQNLGAVTIRRAPLSGK